ncbi:MAG: undecaprenyldiphospho-muramoylpentapeptide beta-N-acetylglucosaminyltransferase [Rickettsiales bacterium]|nr:undecaprenyldiphospho-muramoylpentapeptide beta-N-acetylglucosaminyltransferase [Rickettsiales bacterium]
MSTTNKKNTQSKEQYKVVVATGGTGGHIFPALALDEMLQQDKNLCLILADKRFLNFKSQFSKNLKYKIIVSSSLSGNIFKKLFGALKILFGVLHATILMFQFKPDILVSFGGYPSFPTMVAAVLLRVPILIHEPNSIVGRASKCFLNLAVAVSLCFKETKGVDNMSPKKIFYPGTPMRSEILAARKHRYPILSARGKIYILVLGGSQGAKIFSDVIPKAILLLEPSLRNRIYVYHQCRAENFQNLKVFYKQNKIHAEVKTFFDDIGQKFARSHLIISRSGALTVSELIALGRPAILVPFTFATDNHQFFNARELEKKKAATIILEKNFAPDYLALKLQDLLNNSKKLPSFAGNARKMFKDWNNSFYNLVKNCIQQLKYRGKFLNKR